MIPEEPEDLSGKSFLIWVVSSSRVKGSMKRGWVLVWQWTPVLVRNCGWKKSVSLLTRRMGKSVFEEVVTQGESVAVPVKGVEGSRSALLDSGIIRCVGASFRW